MKASSDQEIRKGTQRGIVRRVWLNTEIVSFLYEV